MFLPLNPLDSIVDAIFFKIKMTFQPNDYQIKICLYLFFSKG